MLYLHELLDLLALLELPYMQIITDLHLHSRFSRAVSPQMTIDGIAGWAGKKGIGLVATGDWTHPMWMREIGEKLEEDGSGLLRLKNSKLEDRKLKVGVENRKSKIDNSNPHSTFQPLPQSSMLYHPSSPRFLLSTEISCIYSQGGKTRRVHVLVWLPTIASAQKISKELTKRGCNLLSDGRPIIGLSLIHLAELVLTIEPNALIVPAHIWTPWFSVYGKMGGFESLEEAFGPYAKHIYAVETGLSSSPDMNWRIKELDSRAIVSFSDAHSGAKLGREVTVFEVDEREIKKRDEYVITYADISEALKQPSLEDRVLKVGVENRKSKIDNSNPHSTFQPLPQSSMLHRLPSIVYTIEFYPEEGKYHYTGHRECNIRLAPEEVVAKGTTCSVCGKPLTQGVMQRVEDLATSHQSSAFDFQKNIKWIRSDIVKNRPPFAMLVPLQEIIAEAIGSPVASKKTQAHYETLIAHFGTEFLVLMDADIDEIKTVSTPQIADGVKKVRTGDIVIDPGYDGVFGVVKIWKSKKEKSLVDKSKEQLGMF